MYSIIRGAGCGFILVSLLVSNVAGIDFPSNISGDCMYDEATDRTICTYVVASGTPALSHLIIPFSENCIDKFEVTSSFFRFENPQAYDDPFCGEIYGIKSDREMGDGQVETFTISYVGNWMHKVGMDVVYAALKAANNCEVYPVPGVADCDFVPQCEFSVNFTVSEFYTRKPGDYAGPIVCLTATSNLPINITFDSFGDLYPQASFGTGFIPALYQTAPVEQVQPPPAFLTPAEFNEQKVIIPDDEEEHSFCIWWKLSLGPEISGCEYSDDAAIVIEIENLEQYIELEP
ncbi:MAG: hypothetical protein JSV52_10730 [Candidatus Zixiibacteriota bacterium]|nr:MAG: hypothetical protein JSV52_10730 [candidate division Zixibacteria bacterium]